MKIDAFWLKITAIITTVVLYLGAFKVIPEGMNWLYYLCGIVGSASITLFAFLLDEAVTKTSNINRLMIRSLICAVVSAFPYHAIMKIVYPELTENAYFSITSYFNPALSALISILAISTFDKLKEKKLQIVLVAMLLLLSYLFNFYGAPFVFITVFIIHYFKNNFGKMAYLLVSINLAFFLVGIFLMLFTGYKNKTELSSMIYQIGYILPLPLIKMYSGEEGFKLKYFTYIFYPLLLLFFMLIKMGFIF